MMNYHETDPEFMGIIEHFTLEEVVKEPGQELPEETRCLAVLATLLGCQGLAVYQDFLPKALDGGLTPVMVKEMVYQAADYSICLTNSAKLTFKIGRKYSVILI